ncbi:MAG: YegS/Rv2252/BmrU family lipid kinase [Bacteroidaceae bacterium]|nr:YegS/Rv2252/BmrU family lipid kinase [Bacteroidaceae bacterium]MBR1801194.1 YegS/Rv2252/BmrU family lipid kinase [Bacteroidaceae bacterium]
MSKTRLLFIANPISGTHDKQPVIDSLPKFLPTERFEWEVAWTDHRGHAAELAANASRTDIDVCVAIGGDGTVNEVARSLCHTETALAIIPMGSGNGLARHIQIPLDPDGALRVLARCDIKALDYGLINETPFFCTCGVGFDAFISEKFAGSGKRGLMTYIDNVLRGGLSYEPETYEVCIDGQTEHHRAFLIACGNASQYGNNFYIAPQASMSDGLLDVTIIEPLNVLDAPQLVMQMMNKTLDNNAHVKTFQCQSLSIHRAQSGVIHYDGEPAEAGTDIEVRLVPKGLRVVVNEEADKSTAPIIHNIQDIFDQITGDIKSQQRKLLAINKSLLDKIRR